MKHLKITASVMVILTLATAFSCKKKDTISSTNNTTNTGGNGGNTTQNWAFTINGVVANTAIKGADNDVANMIINKQNNFATFFFYGDDPSKPRRGMLNYPIENFDFTLGQKNCYASFVSYRDAGGNEDAQYSSKSEGSYTFSITKIDSSGTYPNTQFEFSGTYTCSMGLKLGYTSSRDRIEITKGTFEKIKGVWY